MCGICGYYGLNDKELLKKMTKVIAHRGPDGQDIFQDKNIGLGHRRLSIIDLSSRGNQPMSDEEGSIWITYNGEIYNFFKIKEKLEKKGYKFKSKTDTEVIIYAYKEWGEKCVNLFEGMFSFAIWDSDKKKLFLARDRLGIKPLFYYFDKNVFLFASEIKSLLEYKIERKINPLALKEFITYGYVTGNSTLYNNVKKLLPGHTLSFEKNNIKIKKYWDVNFTHKINSKKKLLKEIPLRLQDSIKKRLISDVPLGVFLSGGVDSGSIVALMSQISDSIKTFTIGFEDQSYDESKYARKIAEIYNTQHFEKIISPEDILKILKEITPKLDTPFGDISMFPTYMVSKLAKKNVSVVLGGDGSDEIFGGYFWFKAQNLYNKYKICPKPVRQIITKMAFKLPVKSQKKGIINKTKKFTEGTLLNPQLEHFRWKIYGENDIYKKSLNKYNQFATLKNYFKSFQGISRYDRMLYVDIKTSLVEDMLTKVDRMSMLNSLEVRVPYLDYHFVDFVSKIPTSFKKDKLILKKSLQKYLPNNILYRDKQGFSIPIKNWLKTELKDSMISLLSEKDLKDYFNQNVINKLINQHISGKKDNWGILWRLMSFEIWKKQFIDKENFIF